jgi:addiction module RelB/DinJ family antitoxin
MTTIQFQIDDSTKTAADSLFRDYGLNMESVLKIFISTAVKQRSIPFSIEEFIKADTIELERIKQRRLSTKGSLKGKVWMSDDFDAPLEEMKEYME